MENNITAIDTVIFRSYLMSLVQWNHVCRRKWRRLNGNSFHSYSAITAVLQVDYILQHLWCCMSTKSQRLQRLLEQFNLRSQAESYWETNPSSADLLSWPQWKKQPLACSNPAFCIYTRSKKTQEENDHNQLWIWTNILSFHVEFWFIYYLKNNNDCKV